MLSHFIAVPVLETGTVMGLKFPALAKLFLKLSQLRILAKADFNEFLKPSAKADGNEI